MRRIYKEVAALAEKESWAYRDFLALLLAEEVAHRKQHVSSVAPGTRTSRSSKPSMSSTSLCNRLFGNPSSVLILDGLRHEGGR